MKRAGILMLCLAVSSPLFAQKKEDDRITNSTYVLKQTVDNGLSHSILSQATCVAVFPSVKKVAIGIGSSYGRGVLVCRKGLEPTAHWTAPVMFSLDSASIGIQLGSTATDFVLTVMTKTAADEMINGKTKLGSNATVAAGPAGAQGNDFSPSAQILTYSRTKGVFAGASLAGANVEPDRDANKSVYGQEMTAQTIIDSAPIVPSATPLVDFLNQIAPGRPHTGGGN